MLPKLATSPRGSARSHATSAKNQSINSTRWCTGFIIYPLLGQGHLTKRLQVQVFESIPRSGGVEVHVASRVSLKRFASFR